MSKLYKHGTARFGKFNRRRILCYTYLHTHIQYNKVYLPENIPPQRHRTTQLPSHEHNEKFMKRTS